MQEFITLDMLANYTIFITIVAAATQLIKEPIDTLTTKIFGQTFSTNYVVFLVSFVLYLLREVAVDGFTWELLLVSLVNAIVISFGSSGFHKLMQDK